MWARVRCEKNTVCSRQPAGHTHNLTGSVTHLDLDGHPCLHSWIAAPALPALSYTWSRPCLSTGRHRGAMLWSRTDCEICGPSCNASCALMSSHTWTNEHLNRPIYDATVAGCAGHCHVGNVFESRQNLVWSHHANFAKRCVLDKSPPNGYRSLACMQAALDIMQAILIWGPDC